MAPLIHASWRRQARTPVAGGISAATTVGDKSESGPSASSAESSIQIDTKPAVTRSAKGLGSTSITDTTPYQETPVESTRTVDTSELHSSAEASPTTISQTNRDNVPETTSSASSEESTSITKISRSATPISSTNALDPSLFSTEMTPRATSAPSTTTVRSIRVVAPSSEQHLPETIISQGSANLPKLTIPGVEISLSPGAPLSIDIPKVPSVSQTRIGEGATAAVTTPSSCPRSTPASETTSIEPLSSVVASTSLETSTVTTRTARDGPGNALPTDSAPAVPTTSVTTTKTPENGQNGTPVSTNSPNASPTLSASGSIPEEGGQKPPLTTNTPPLTSSTPTSRPSLPNSSGNAHPTNIVSPSVTPPVITNVASDAHVSGITASPTPTNVKAEAARGPESLSTSTFIVTLTSTSQTIFMSGSSTITKAVTTTNTQTRTTVVPIPTSTVVGTTTSGTKAKTTAMVGGILGAAIFLAILLFAWYFIRRRRRRNEEMRTFLVTSPDPFPHSARPSSQAMSPVSSLGSRRMMIQAYPSTPMPQSIPSDAGPLEMVERLSDHAPTTTVTRKKPIPFLNTLDLNTENRLSVQSTSSLSMNLSPDQARGHPAAAENPFADPDRNPFEDPHQVIPTVVVLPATPEPRQSVMSASSSLKEYGIAM